MISSPPTVRLHLLGRALIEVAGVQIAPDAERLFALLLVLACDSGKPRPRDELVRLLWSEMEAERGRHNLRQTVYKARQLGVPLETIGEDTLLARAHVWCDWEDGEVVADADWLPHYDASFSAPLEAWVTQRRQQAYRALRPRVLARMQAARAAGEIVLAEQWASCALRLDPLNEEAHLVLAECRALQGAKADALALLNEYISEVEANPSLVDAVLPAKLLRRRIGERLPVASYVTSRSDMLLLRGREREKRHLLASIQDVRGGRGDTLWIWGAEGMGKSRLVREVEGAAAIHGVSFVRNAGRGFTPGSDPCLRLTIDFLLTLPGALGITPESLQRLQSLPLHADTGDDTTRQICNDIHELLDALAHERPLIVSVDMCEGWSAREVGILVSAACQSQSRRHGLLVSSRVAPKWIAPWLPRTAYTPLHVAPLRPTVIGDILKEQESILGPTASPIGASLCAEISEGNPLFALELLGHSRNASDGDLVPYRIRRALRAATDALSPGEVQVLVFVWAHGGCADLEYLAGAGEQAKLHETIDRLLSDNLIRQEGNGYRCSPLIDSAHDYVLGPWLSPTVVYRCAAALRSAFLRDADPELGLRAIELLLRFGSQDLASNWFERDVAQLQRLSEGTRLIAWLKRIQGHALLSESITVFARAYRELHLRAMTGVPATQPPIYGLPWVEALPTVSDEEAAFYDLDTKRAQLEPLLAKASNSLLPATDRVRNATHALVVCDNLKLKDFAPKAIAALEVAALDPQARAIDVARGRMVATFACNDFKSQELAIEQLVIESRAIHDAAEAARALRNASQAHLRRGDLVRAEAVARESLRIARRSGYPAQEMFTLLTLIDIALVRNRPSDAHALLHLAQEIGRTHSLETSQARCDLVLAEGYLSAYTGDWRRTAKLANRIYRLSAQNEGLLVRWQFWVLRDAARIAAGDVLDETELAYLTEPVFTQILDNAASCGFFVMWSASRRGRMKDTIGSLVHSFISWRTASGQPAVPVLELCRN